jgi:hypothetical protein
MKLPKIVNFGRGLLNKYFHDARLRGSLLEGSIYMLSANSFRGYGLFLHFEVIFRFSSILLNLYYCMKIHDS